MIACNLMSLLHQGIMRNNTVSDKPDAQYTLKTLRYKLFAETSHITHGNRKKITNLAVTIQ